MTKDDKYRVLEVVNKLLQQHKLPRIAIEQLGDASRGEAEIQGVSHYQILADGCLEITYRVDVPHYGEKDIPVRFGSSSCVLIPMFSVSQNGEPATSKVALVKKWRVENNDWSYELPRGRILASEYKLLEDPNVSPICRIIGLTFGEECRRALDCPVIVNVGKLTHRGEAASLDIIVVQATITKNFLRRPGDGRIVLVPREQLMKLIDEDNDKTTRITEVVTTAALLKAARKLGW
ncbi:MAG: hypothetical protein WCT10_05445 [Patescibacteria group bacterium]|jgi:hypothetical protein